MAVVLVAIGTAEAIVAEVSSQPIFGGHMSGGVLLAVQLVSAAAVPDDDDDDNATAFVPQSLPHCTGCRSSPGVAIDGSDRDIMSVLAVASGESSGCPSIEHVDNRSPPPVDGGVSGDGFRSTAVYWT